MPGEPPAGLVGHPLTRSAPLVVHDRAGGQIAVSSPDGVVWLIPMEARQLALDLNRASLPARPDPPVDSRGLIVRGFVAIASYTVPLAIIAVFALGIVAGFLALLD